MADYTPVTTDQASVTLTAGAVIVGGQLVDITGVNTVSPSAGALRPIGVAAHDAASGARVTIHLLPGLIHEVPIKNTVTIAAGAPVIPAAAAAGRVDTVLLATAAGAGTLLGVCLNGGTGNAGGTVLCRFLGM